MDPAVRFESIHRVNQTDSGDLNQVLKWFTTPGEAARQVLGHRQITTDQLLAHPVALRVITSQLGITRCTATRCAYSPDSVPAEGTEDVTTVPRATHT